MPKLRYLKKCICFCIRILNVILLNIVLTVRMVSIWSKWSQPFQFPVRRVCNFVSDPGQSLIKIWSVTLSRFLVCNLIKILSYDDDTNNFDVVNVKVDVVIGKRYYYLVKPLLVGSHLS